MNRFSQQQFTKSTVELVVELALVRGTYTKTGHLALKFLLVAHDSFILNEVQRMMTASILLFQSNEEDLQRKWEYANFLNFRSDPTNGVAGNTHLCIVIRLKGFSP